VVDGDDRLDREGLIALIELLEKTDCDLVASNYRKVFPDGSSAGDMCFKNVEFGTTYNFEQLAADGSIYFGIHSSTFKTEILRKNSIRLQEHTFYVDTEYALLPIPFINTVVFLQPCVYLYTVGSAQQSIDAANFVKRYDDHLRVVTRLAGFADECLELGVPLAQTDYIFSVLAKLCFTQYMLAAFYDEDIKRGRQRARDFDKWLKKHPRLYETLSKSLYIRFLRATYFSVLPRGRRLKKAARKSFNLIKRLFGKHKLTY
jgi:hypothetical protein